MILPVLHRTLFHSSGSKIFLTALLPAVAITPNGMFSYVSPCYGGRASDTFIFNNCAFVSWLEPNGFNSYAIFYGRTRKM
jgi:hypothetical protein